MINCKDLKCAKRNSDNNSGSSNNNNKNNNNNNNNTIQIIVYENMLRFYDMWQYSASGYLISARLCTLIVRVPEAAFFKLWYLLNINFCFPCICVKSVQIRFFSGLYFPIFGLNTDQKKLGIWTIFTQFVSAIYDVLNIGMMNFQYKLQQSI